MPKLSTDLNTAARFLACVDDMILETKDADRIAERLRILAKALKAIGG